MTVENIALTWSPLAAEHQISQIVATREVSHSRSAKGIRQQRKIKQ